MRAHMLARVLGTGTNVRVCACVRVCVCACLQTACGAFDDYSLQYARMHAQPHSVARVPCPSARANVRVFAGMRACSLTCARPASPLPSWPPPPRTSVREAKPELLRAVTDSK